MNTQSKIDAQKIHIVNLITLKGNINGDSNIDTNSIVGHRFQFNVEQGFNFDESLVGLLLTVDVVAINDEDKELNVTGSYTHEFVFKVDNLAEFSSMQKDEEGNLIPHIEASLGATLVSIAYSTIRGIIFTRTQGTALGTVVLPVVNPLNLLR